MSQKHECNKDTMDTYSKEDYILEDTDAINKEMWKKFWNGESISNLELRRMISQAKLALEYLEARGERFWLAATVTRRDLQSLKDFARNRNLKL